LKDRKFNMALGRILGGSNSINALVWSRRLERDYDSWGSGAKGWAFKGFLAAYKSQEDWEDGANEWCGGDRAEFPLRRVRSACRVRGMKIERLITNGARTDRYRGYEMNPGE
jgi:choline dehydrogenase-like flavoprotein